MKPEWLRIQCHLQHPNEDYRACVRALAEQAGPVDPRKRDHYGEFYDPLKYVECRLPLAPGNMRCEYLILKRREQPEFWPYPDVPAPKLPAPPNPPVYQSGMTSREYFQALCKAEAGEFIYRTVDNVEGIYQIRPRWAASSTELNDRFVLEDPYGYTHAEASKPPYAFVARDRYQYFEAPAQEYNPRHPVSERPYYHPSLFEPLPQGAKYRRYFGYDNRDLRTMERVFANDLKSSYGFTWREIRRPHDRELGIVGGELIVLDLRTNEVLGVRRGFTRSGEVRNAPSGFNWEISSVCPGNLVRPGVHKTEDFSFWFVSKVLKPAKHN